jgi:hypothetical protein
MPVITETPLPTPWTALGFTILSLYLNFARCLVMYPLLPKESLKPLIGMGHYLTYESYAMVRVHIQVTMKDITNRVLLLCACWGEGGWILGYIHILNYYTHPCFLC